MCPPQPPDDRQDTRWYSDQASSFFFPCLETPLNSLPPQLHEEFYKMFIAHHTVGRVPCRPFSRCRDFFIAAGGWPTNPRGSFGSVLTPNKASGTRATPGPTCWARTPSNVANRLTPVRGRTRPKRCDLSPECAVDDNRAAWFCFGGGWAKHGNCKFRRSCEPMMGSHEWTSITTLQATVVVVAKHIFSHPDHSAPEFIL